MYRTRVKENFRKIYGANGDKLNIGEEEYIVLLTMGDMSLLYNPETELMFDIYNNKLEEFQEVDLPTVIVKAKNSYYEKVYDIRGLFYISSFWRNNRKRTTELNLVSVNNPEIKKSIFPSRLRVVSVDDN